jgi:hypothetical protein
MAAKIGRTILRTAMGAALALCAGALAHADTDSPEDVPPQVVGGISQDQAKSLVLAYLQESGTRLDAADFELESDPTDPEIPDFFLFSAYYNSRNSLRIIGAFAVNRRTAALWQRLNCQELKSETLSKLKDKMPTTTLGIDRPGTLTCF